MVNIYKATKGKNQVKDFVKIVFQWDLAERKIKRRLEEQKVGRSADSGELAEGSDFRRCPVRVGGKRAK